MTLVLIDKYIKFRHKINKKHSDNMFLKNFLLISNASKLSRWSSLAYSIKKYSRRYTNKSHYFKCDDVEKGIKHPYIQSKTYNNNENEVKTSSRNELINVEQKLFSVNFSLGLKIVGSLIVITLASLFAIYMDNFNIGLATAFVALLIIIFITGLHRWFYIAAVTSPRDVLWVSLLQLFTWK